jgi:hypothetical protein
MRLLLILVAALAISRAGHATPYPALDTDSRLRHVITIQHPPAKLGVVLQIIAHETGVNLVCQGDLLNQPVLVQVKNRPAREILADIALGNSGTWIRRKEDYVLMQAGPVAGFVARHQTTEAAHESIRRLGRSLTPAQLSALRSRPLSIRELAPEQQYWLTVCVHDEYYTNPNEYPQSVVNTSQGVELKLSRDSTTGAEILNLCMPQVIQDHGITPPLTFRGIQLPVRG